jgi:shikimate kinase
MTRDLRPPSALEKGVALVGYRGTGKSTVGRILAERLNRPFVDADLELEARTGRSIAAIFAAEGEPVFREWEERVLADLTTAFPRAVLATGGGAVLRQSNRNRIREFGLVVWLRADPAKLVRRLAADQAALESRPALTEAGTLAEIASVLKARTPLYQVLADMAVDTDDKTVDDVATVILGYYNAEALSP